MAEDDLLPRDEATKLFQELQMPPPGASKAWFQGRGRDFEKVIVSCLASEGLEPRSSFKPAGEEIDGSFELGGRVFLLEAKWRNLSTPASDLLAFKGKVDGKLSGTLGVFITMSGYSPKSVEALTKGKEINLILFSPEDFSRIVRGEITFSEAMKQKLRYAAEEGSPFLPLSANEVIRPGILSTTQSHPPVDVSYFDIGSRTTPRLTKERWNFVVEGKWDEIALSTLFKRMYSYKSLDIHFWIAEGPRNIAALVRNLKRSDEGAKIVAIADNDAAGQAIDEVKHDAHLIMADPTLEDWLVGAVPPGRQERPLARSAEAMAHLASVADLDLLKQTNADFASLLVDMKLHER